LFEVPATILWSRPGFDWPLRAVTRQGWPNAMRSRFNIHGRRVAIHQTYSYDAGLLHELKDLSIDLLFIDGDHQQESVLQDFELYSPLVVSGGFIVSTTTWTSSSLLK
jgi:hypothetical protein